MELSNGEKSVMGWLFDNKTYGDEPLRLWHKPSRVGLGATGDTQKRKQTHALWAKDILEYLLINKGLVEMNGRRRYRLSDNGLTFWNEKCLSVTS